eukprot:118913-Amphidinium_carterae.1
MLLPRIVLLTNAFVCHETIKHLRNPLQQQSRHSPAFSGAGQRSPEHSPHRNKAIPPSKVEKVSTVEQD